MRLAERQHIAIPKERLLYGGQIPLLASCACPGILPAHVVEKGDWVHVFYKTAGFYPVKDEPCFTAESMVKLLRSLVINQKRVRQWLLFPEEYVLSQDTVYIERDYNQVRFLYIPDGKRIRASRRMECFLHQLGQRTTESGRTYLKAMEPLLACGNPDTGHILSVTDEMLAEIRICKIR